MLRAIIALATVAIAVFALADCASTEERRARYLPKLVWVLVIVFLPWVGPLAWLTFGREAAPSAHGTERRRPALGTRTRPMAPDEDPEFLAKLDRDIRDERRRQQTEAEAAGTPPHTAGDPDVSPDVTKPTGDIDDPDEDDGARR